MKRENGFSSMILIASSMVVILLLIGGLIYKTQSHRSPQQQQISLSSITPSVSPFITPTSSDSSEEVKTYTDPTLHINFQYSPDWVLKQNIDSSGTYALQLTNASDNNSIITINANWSMYKSVAQAFAKYSNNTPPISITVANHPALKYEPQNDRQNTGIHQRSVFFENSHNQIIQVTLESKNIQSVGQTFKQFLSLIQDTN